VPGRDARPAAFGERGSVGGPRRTTSTQLVHATRERLIGASRLAHATRLISAVGLLGHGGLTAAPLRHERRLVHGP
jgi:hypothetical protein